MDLKVHEGIVAEELECILHHSGGHDLPMELYKARASVNKIVDDRATEVERLSRQLMQVAGILIDLGLPPIEDIPHLPKIVWDALTAVTLILECLQGALDSGAGPWDYTPFPPFFSSALEATVGENMVIYICIYIYIYMFTMEGAEI
jgi:hypothetical protein